jgi:hypothetical protein
MKPHGTYRLLGSNHEPDDARPEVALGNAMRTQRIVDSLRCEISNSEYARELRIRQVFTNPREIFRIEFEVPEMNYQRTTLLDRDALEELLEVDEIRALLREPIG